MPPAIVDGMDDAAREVCQAYAVTQGGCQLHPLGNAGGFSGARLWRVEAFGGNYCLRLWPKDGPRQRLAFIHRFMQQAAQGLPFVPRLCVSTRNRSRVIEQGRYWEMTSWMPGVADFRLNPTKQRLKSAMW